MKITKEYFQKAYKINDEQLRKFSELCRLFINKNNEINLSSFNSEEEIWSKHFFDSTVASKYIANYNKILDLGSGGGFPVLPLAILFPSIDFIATDSINKKCDAIGSFINNLDIKNVKVINDRAEKLAHNEEFREKIDLLTARAFAKFPTLLEIALPFLKIDGLLISFRGLEEDKDDLLLLKKLGGELIEIKNYLLPTGEKRKLWIIKKIQKSAKSLPRAIGLPKKRPLTINDKI